MSVALGLLGVAPPPPYVYCPESDSVRRAPGPPCRRKMLAVAPGRKEWPGLLKKSLGGI